MVIPKYHGNTMGLSSMRVSWDPHATSMRWAMELLREFHGVGGAAMMAPVGFKYSHETSVIFPWDIHGSSMGLPSGTSTEFLFVFFLGMV